MATYESGQWVLSAPLDDNKDQPQWLGMCQDIEGWVCHFFLFILLFFFFFFVISFARSDKIIVVIRYVEERKELILFIIIGTILGNTCSRLHSML